MKILKYKMQSHCPEKNKVKIQSSLGSVLNIVANFVESKNSVLSDQAETAISSANQAWIL